MNRQQGRGGMGSHKHGVSGRPGKSPRLRHAMKRMAEADERKAQPSIRNPKNSVRELLEES